MRNYILATAGHVDHGKSALVKALTGTDPDRLPEEKARGITIELGFAHLSLPGLHLGIVDVPGHEDFVKNMVAGVGSIDVALLIVAADDGWMPQTEEHLQILTYLGVPRAVVALTKSDLIAPGDESQRVTTAIRQKLAGTPYQHAPVVNTSIINGAGLDELKESLAAVLAEARPSPDIGKPRLPVDRVFTLQGVGTVVTGTLNGGTLRRGQQVVIQPTKTLTRVRTVQSHNREVEVSPPGTRTALNLPDVSATHDATQARVERGYTVTSPDMGDPQKVANVLLEKSGRVLSAGTPAATPLRDGTRVRVHHSSANYPARILIPWDGPLAPGTRRIAQIRFESPVFIFTGDRFILRDWSEQWTLAGGIVLDADPPARGLRSPSHREFLSERAQSPEDLRTLVTTLLKRDQAVRRATLLRKCRFSTEQIVAMLESLAAQRAVVLDNEWAIDAEWWNDMTRKAREAIAEDHRAHPDRPGLALNDLRRVLSLPEAALFDLALRELCRNGFIQRGTAIRHAEHRLALPPQLQVHGQRLRKALSAKPFEPPSRKELAPDPASQQTLRFLIQTGEAIELDPDTPILADTYARATQVIKDHLAKTGAATASDLRQALNTNRRVIIPLLERLDRDGVTIRQGDKRVLKQK